MVQITDEGELIKTITAIIEANPNQLTGLSRRQRKAFWIFCRSGDEGHSGQGQSATRQRSAQKDACRMMIKTVFWKNNTVVLIDQNALPLLEQHVACQLSGSYCRNQRFNRTRCTGHRCRRRYGCGFGRSCTFHLCRLKNSEKNLYEFAMKSPRPGRPRAIFSGRWNG